MQIIKYILLIGILIASILIGRLISKKYVDRVKELKEMKNALNIFKTKMRFTYEPIPDIFEEIAKQLTNGNIATIFLKASKKMKQKTAGQAWEEALEEENNLNKEDKEILNSLSRLLGKTDLEGQLSEVEVTTTFLETQIKKAEEARKKNEKMYQTLGMVAGLAIVIVLL